MISTDLYYAKDQYDERGKRSSDYNHISHEIYTIWHDRISHPSIELDAKD